MSATSGSGYVGWVLRSNRRFAGNADFHLARNFARAFRLSAESGLAPSQITRWEQGTTTASRGVLRRYEQLLGVPPESFVVVSDAMRRSEGLTFDVTPGRQDDQSRLYELLDRALAPGEMTGADWGVLTELIAAQPALVLYPPGLWTVIAGQVLSELVVSENTAWLQRQEAISRLLEHPVARPHAVAACVGMADDQSSPAVIEPVSLLDVVAHDDANRYVLRQIENPSSERARYAGLLAAVRKIRHGHFAGDDYVRLARAVRQAMSDSAPDSSIAPLLAQVATALNRRMPAQPPLPGGLRATGSYAPANGATAQRTGAHVVSQRVADLAQVRLGDHRGRDPVLARLVGQALFHANPDQRLMATMLISATPYREPVAGALLMQLQSDLSRRVEEMAATALSMLTTLHVDIHRPLMRTILASRASNASLRHAAAWATPHCAGRYSLASWRQILAEQIAAWSTAPSGTAESILHGLTYGIGTDRHRELLIELQQRTELPTAVRQTAHWLLSSPSQPPA